MTYDFKATVDFPEEAIEWKIVWHRLEDACKKCMELADYSFYGVGNLPQVLIHPVYGPVWDLLSDVPLTHDHCRCMLDPYLRVNWSAIPEIKTVSMQLGIEPLIATVEWLDVSGIAQYREELKGIRTEVGHVTGEFRELEYLTYRVISVLGRLGLPPKIDACLTKIQQVILAVRLLHTSLMLLESSTPYGWALAAVSLVSAGITISAAAEMDARGPVY